MKIISGAQTGVDRAALDAALDSGVKTGGWCPEGRMADDGIISEKYPVKELPKSGYRQRTKRNVIDSDGTVIIYFDYPFPGGGTEQTIVFCIKERKPYVLIDAEELTIERASRKIKKFIDRNTISVLNVAGPNAGVPKAYQYTKKVILSVLQSNSS
ncbi:putative molybdenum carrier protein [Candidatus Parabeggiatoa sp. HSG14]|uniref:putative molybdenum carrier protein n=1 Tax=Candidatus Parabeggiatoa sp. HSG14 TaxID=3055593 RepID=UPI0025A84E09|nr:putative molybdenum carrier protein [Thiotrichales bacterium HSG14]